MPVSRRRSSVPSRLPTIGLRVHKKSNAEKHVDIHDICKLVRDDDALNLHSNTAGAFPGAPRRDEKSAQGTPQVPSISEEIVATRKAEQVKILFHELVSHFSCEDSWFFNLLVTCSYTFPVFDLYFHAICVGS